MNAAIRIVFCIRTSEALRLVRLFTAAQQVRTVVLWLASVLVLVHNNRKDDLKLDIGSAV